MVRSAAHAATGVPFVAHSQDPGWQLLESGSMATMLSSRRLDRTVRLPLLVALLAVSAPPHARANLRAPRRLPQDGSSALYGVAAVEVKREELSFACTRDTCEVTASYTVQADQAQQVELSFIVPGSARVHAKVAGNAVTPRVISAEALSPRELESLSLDTRSDTQTLHKAVFHAALAAGQNVIEVRYTQRGDGVERGYGYFSEGHFVYQLRYELWPLKEWTLAPDFTLTLHVAYQREKAPSLVKRWFGGFQTIACGTELGKRVGPRVSRSERSVRFSVQMGAADMPDRLICSIGRESMVDLPD